MRFRSFFLPVLILVTGWLGALNAEEKNGIQCSVQKVTLDRADARVDLNVQTLDRMMALRVALRNTGFKPVPGGEIVWEILKRKFDNAAIELTSGTEPFAGLKAGENVELTMGSARVAGLRDGAILRQDDLEWRITIRNGAQDIASFTSKSSFPVLLKRAVKVEVPGTPPPAAAVPAPAPAAPAKP